MKTTSILKALGVCGMFATAVQAGLPLAPTVTYGLIRNEYGQPILSGADVAIIKNDGSGTVCAHQMIEGLFLPGVNYRLSLELESGAPLRRIQAALVGDPMRIAVTIGGVDQPLTPNPAFPAPSPGVARRIDYATGIDSDGDGIPDAWKALMVLMSDGFFTSIDDIKAHEDPDEDGLTNLQEFLAGTLPFLATDVFQIVDVERDPETRRFKLRFSTTDALRTYHVLTSTGDRPENWIPIPSTLTPDGELIYQTYPGNNRVRTVYVDGSLPQGFFRIAVN